MRAWAVAMGVCLACAKAWAQDYPRHDFDASRLVDELLATQDLDLNYQDLFENYLQLISNPLDLNSASREQLQSLYVLRPEDIDRIENHRANTGPFISVYELQTFLDRETFYRLIPFVTVPDVTQSFNKSILRRIVSEPNNYLLLRWGRTLEPQAGYSGATPPSIHYLGTPDNFYARFRVSRPGDFSAGFTLKKDAGEKMIWAPEKKNFGFDYISFHFQAVAKKRFRNVILGDYQAQFGQGIALGSLFGLGKNGEAVTTMRRANLGFMPYTSLYEAGYFRGAAISYDAGRHLTIHGMASLRGRDGNVQQDTLATTTDYLSSIAYSGLHRTAAEIINRNSISETNLATVLQYRRQSLDAGIILHHTRFSTPLLPTPSVYNRFEFKGDANTNAGVYVNYNFANAAFFSEMSQTVHHGRALVTGMLVSITPRFDATITFRKFDRNYYGFYSNAIAENSTPQNETGLYWGWKYTLGKKYAFAGYCDLFLFPWLKYRSYAPSTGNEWLLRFDWKPTRSVSAFVQTRTERKARNTGVDTNLYLTDVGTKQSYWLNCDYEATKKLSFRVRLQASTYSIGGKNSQGMVLLHDVTYHSGRFSISGRYALFDTDNYDNRLYVYERDAWLAFTFPAYDGRGIRNYLLLEYRLARGVDLWLRWGHTRYAQGGIGSGGDAIAGDTRNDIKLQARIKL